MNVVLDNIRELSFAENEAFKTLRTNVTFCGDEVRAIALTSSIPNEGKSEVCFNLARSFAEDGKKVLLIDADIRNSVLHARLGADRELMGLSHLLSRKTDVVSNAIATTNIPNLSILFAGPKAPNASEQLGSKRFKSLVSQLRSHYDYIIIDCPPLGAVIDAAIIAKQCDGAIVLIEEGTISYKLVKGVKEQLEKSGCRILGTVLNKVTIQGKGYGYGYGYGYGEEED